MELEKLWESKGGVMDSIEIQARITRYEGEYHLEIVSRNLGFWDRLRNAWKYIFRNADVIKSIVPLSEKDIRELSHLRVG